MKLRPLSLAASLGMLSILGVPLLTATPWLAFADEPGAAAADTAADVVHAEAARSGAAAEPAEAAADPAAADPADADPAAADPAPAEAAYGSATAEPAAAKAPTPPPGFEAVTGPGAAQADVDPVPLVIIAYLFIWAMVLGYLVVLWRRQGRVNEELASLAQRLERAARE